MLTEKDHQSAAEALYRAEVDRVLIDRISITYPEAEIPDAYRISQLVTELKVSNGRKLKGHKIGLVSKAMQEMAGVREPDYGDLFDNWFVDEGSVIPTSRLNRPRLEVEFAFVLLRDLSGSDVNAVDVIRATDFVLPAFEILDTRYNEKPGNEKKRIVDSIADSAGCGLVVLGGNPIPLSDVDLRRAGASLRKNGVVEVSGVASAVMGNPINAVAWLARKLSEYDTAVKAGQTILSGSFVRAIQIDSGDGLTADFGELGVLSFSLL
jgi:2-keto-4-pentenoate hydratase